MVSPASDPHIGGISQVWIDITLYYKDNESPLANQSVYLIVGNETITYITDENGKICEVFRPDKYGLLILQFLFNESKINVNGTMIDLEPISIYTYYFFESRNYLLLSNPVFNMNSIINNKKTTLSLDSSIYTNKQKKYSENRVFGKMKQSGVPLNLLLLLFLATLSVLFIKGIIGKIKILKN